MSNQPSFVAKTEQETLPINPVLIDMRHDVGAK